jgi:hypothetical protein
MRPPTNNETMATKNKNKSAAKADTNNENTKAADAPKRGKANYDIVKGELVGHITQNPGITLNGLHEHFGIDGKTGQYKFPVIYQGVQQLKGDPAKNIAPIIFGTDAKKNEGLYMTEAEAIKNRPEPTTSTPRKKDQPYVLEKQVKDGKWRAVEGGSDRKPIEASYKTASVVPGSTFRVVDNTGDEQKVLMTNEVATKPEPKAKTTEKETEKVS